MRAFDHDNLILQQAREAADILCLDSLEIQKALNLLESFIDEEWANEKAPAVENWEAPSTEEEEEGSEDYIEMEEDEEF